MTQPITAFGLSATAGPGGSVASPSRRERLFRAARTHSRLVRLLRIVVPGAVAACLAVLLAIWLNPFRAPPPQQQSLSPAAISGSKITMELPRLAGFTRDSRAYEFSARSAAQDVAAPTRVEMTDIRAKVEMQDKAVVEMIAPLGVYDSKTERLTLSKEIKLVSSAGHEGRLQEAVVDVRSGEITSNSPVELKFLNGNLSARSLKVGQSGDLIRFDGGVAMLLTFGARADGGASPP